MKTLLTALTFAHVGAGIIALLIGIVPMVVRKGSRLHNRAGLVYVYCMIAVAITALLLCLMQPFKLIRLFLTGIAVLSFYLCVSGWRATKQKRSSPGTFDRGLIYAALGAAAAMVAFGTYLLAINGPLFLPIVFTFFGVLMGRFALRDVRALRQPTEPMHWFYQHFTRMGGSYVATFTAAIVTNAHRFLPANGADWLLTFCWIAPSVLGGWLIGRTVVHYKRKQLA